MARRGPEWEKAVNEIVAPSGSIVVISEKLFNVSDKQKQLPQSILQELFRYSHL